jgi:hypothetical protein
MKCQSEGCKRTATLLITEVSDVETRDLHLCEWHANEYVQGDERLQKERRETLVSEQSRPGTEAMQQFVRWMGELLSRFQPAALVATCAALLSDPQPTVRWLAVVVLARVGRDNPETIAALRGALADQDDDVRQTAAWALGRCEQAGAIET